MKSNWSTKTFAEYLRKLVEEAGEGEWRLTPRKGVEVVDSPSLEAEFEELYGPGKWYFFNVSEWHEDRSKSECGVYVGPKRTYLVEGCHRTGGAGALRKADEMFERRLRDALAGRGV